jgi:hypothetical protein
MKDLMTITLSPNKPGQTTDGEYTIGQEATIFIDEKNGTFGYRYHGVNYRGERYESKNHTGFKTKQSAIKDVVENYNIGTGC